MRTIARTVKRGTMVEMSALLLVFLATTVLLILVNP